jgi:hypothetical protein
MLAISGSFRVKQILTNLFDCAYNIPMQSNKAPKKTRKIAHETATAADNNAAAEATTSPRSAKSSKPKKAETSDMGIANHQHKTGSSAPEAIKTENAPAIKTVAAAARQENARSVSHDEIAKLAHSYWAARGYEHGSAEADWLRAEQKLQASR